MGWVLDKIDRLAGTLFAALLGVAASQFQAFVQAYLQRLGGHLDEARRMAHEFETRGGVGDAAPGEQVVAVLQQRIAELEAAIRAIGEANPYMKPVAFFAHMDPDIAAAAAKNFTPALPLDTPGLVYAFAGAILGWAVWEIVKWPVRAALSRDRSGGPERA